MNFLQPRYLPGIIVAVAVAVAVCRLTDAAMVTLASVRNDVTRAVDHFEKAVNALKGIEEMFKKNKLFPFRDEFIEETPVWDMPPPPTAETPEPVARSDCPDGSCSPQYQYQRDRWGRPIKVKVTP